MEVITTDAMRTVADAAGWDAGLQYDVYQKEEKTSAGRLSAGKTVKSNFLEQA